MRRQRIRPTLPGLAFTAAIALGTPAAAQDLEILSLDWNGQFSGSDARNVDISGDGRFVVFQGSQLLPGEVTASQVYLRDRRTGVLERISVATDGGEADQGAQIAIWPSQKMISHDGRFVVFRSTSSNLLDPPINGGTPHIYRRDRLLGVTQLMSVASNGDPANGPSFDYTLSPDGGVVAFNSTATNLDPFDVDANGNVFLHETLGHTTRLACFDDFGAKIDSCNRFAISCGGGSIVFWTPHPVTATDDNGSEDVYVAPPLIGGFAELLTADRNGTYSSLGFHGHPSISCDGQRIAFASSLDMVFEDEDGDWDLYVIQRGIPLKWRIVDAEGNSTRSNVDVEISPNGGFVVFGTAEALDPIDTNGFGDYYLAEIVADDVPVANLSLATRNAGQVANWANWYASVSDFGEVAFSSEASNLLPFPDPLGKSDVFAPVPLPLFADGFESGSTGSWSTVVP